MGAYFTPDSGDLPGFVNLTMQNLAPERAPRAARIVSNVPIYDMGALARDLEDPAARQALMAEWAAMLRDGSGVVVLESACPDTGPIDAATAIFEEIITDERAADQTRADHFAAGGANDRIWNALQKLCLRDPEVFALYFGNPSLAAVCEAWLGPGYQMTAQVNVVRPGGQAQTAHRDYHLGFQTAEVAATFPAHVHELSAVMTLQGAVAHCDMPVESGPTRLLPFSQAFPEGYMAYRRPDFAAYFEDRAVQVPLKKGDAVFFNPALFHAAGENRSNNISRMANLLQISSPFGRAMESVDRNAMARALFPALTRLQANGRLTGATQAAAIAAAAEGYSFPTNLDTDPPVSGLAPETQAALLARALRDGMDVVAFEAALTAQIARRTA